MRSVSSRISAARTSGSAAASSGMVCSITSNRGCAPAGACLALASGMANLNLFIPIGEVVSSLALKIQE